MSSNVPIVITCAMARSGRFAACCGLSHQMYRRARFVMVSACSFSIGAPDRDRW